MVIYKCDRCHTQEGQDIDKPAEKDTVKWQRVMSYLLCPVCVQAFRDAFFHRIVAWMEDGTVKKDGKP